MQLSLFSPAKINLFLRVLSKRPDGYHNLSSLFQTVALGDTLHVKLSRHDHLYCSSSSIPSDHSNLIYKALHLFRKKTASKEHFSIELDKKIPIEAGLGGGSSNAATALWAFNQLTGNHVPLKTLQEWSIEIGSDVPFFFSEGTAYCSGRGEQVINLPALKSMKISLVKPQQGLSTQHVFQSYQTEVSTFTQEQLKQLDFETSLKQDFSFFNDLEKAAFILDPSLLELKKHLLNSGFDHVVMSGSGTAFICIGAGTIATKIAAQVYPTSYCQRSPENWYCCPI